MNSIDFGRPFSFVFEDQDWLKKIGLGALHALGILVCYLGFFPLMGWQKRLILATAEGREVPLPEWDRFGEDFVEGLKMFCIWLVYLLPSLLIQICAGFANGILSQDHDTAGIGAVISVGSMCVYLPLQLLGTFVAPVAIIRFVNGNSLGSAFKFGEVVGFVRNNFVNVLLVFVVAIAAQMIAFFSIAAFCIGVFFGIAYQNAILGNARGQLLKIARAQGLQPGT